MVKIKAGDKPFPGPGPILEATPSRRVRPEGPLPLPREGWIFLRSFPSGGNPPGFQKNGNPAAGAAIGILRDDPQNSPPTLMTLIHLLTALCPLLLIATASFAMEETRSPAEGEQD